MTECTKEYSIGDWIVHLYYGVGQIKKIEVKPLLGENVECYRVQTKAGTYWLPIEEEDNPRVRPITSREGIKRGLEILNNRPRHIKADYKEVKKWIEEVKSEGSFVSIARLLRDLSARSTVKKLNVLEEQTFKSFSEQLLKEWSLCMGISIDAAQAQLHNILQQTQDLAY
jgi:CarD family transcriptional regulator